MFHNDIGFARTNIPVSPPKEPSTLPSKVIALTSVPEQPQTKTTTVPVSTTSTNNVVGVAERTNEAVKTVYQNEKKAIENAVNNPTLSEVQSWILKNELLVGIIAVIVIILVIIMIM